VFPLEGTPRKLEGLSHRHVDLTRNVIVTDVRTTSYPELADVLAVHGYLGNGVTAALFDARRHLARDNFSVTCL